MEPLKPEQIEARRDIVAKIRKNLKLAEEATAQAESAKDTDTTAAFILLACMYMRSTAQEVEGVI
jgi:hypothetical protein